MAEKLKIPVRGMHCAACVLNVENSLKQIDAIQTARVNLDEQSAYIEIENGNLKADEIVERIKKSGYEVPVEERCVKTKGMHCAACVLNVENALKKVPVVLDARVNLDEEIAYVKIIPVENIEDLISNAISKAGYEYAGFMEEGTADTDMEIRIEEELNQKKRRIWVSLPVGILLMLGNHSAFVPFLKNPLIQLLLAFPAFVYAASPILKAGWSALRHGNLNMDVMYSMGMLVAFLSSLLATFTPVLDNHFLFYDTSVLLAAFLTIGRFLETRAKGKTSSAIKALTKLQPNISHRLLTQDIKIEMIVSRTCPHWEAIRRNLNQAVSICGLSNKTEVVFIEDLDQLPEQYAGSPTILLNGTDLFGDNAQHTDGIQDSDCRRFNISGKEMEFPDVHSITERILKMLPSEDIETEQIRKGDILIVKPGEKVPVDGRIISGQTEINESMITGEPLPVLRKQDDQVIAGTLNINKPFIMVAEKVGSETVLSQIVSMVREAQLTRPPIQKLADKLVTYFIPIVLSIAIITFVFWYFIIGKSFLFSLTTFISILVIACPCALGLATPTALTVGLGKAAELGILIKNAEVLELANKINTIVLDKTGTITEGKPEVISAIWYEESDYLKGILKALENNSNHPLAGAVIEYLEKENVEQTIPVENAEEIAGQGITGEISGIRYGVGNQKLLETLGVQIDKLSEKEEETGAGKTVVYFASEQEIIAKFTIVDKIKQGSVKAIQKLRESGYRVIMLTGDRQEAAEVIAKELNIEVLAEMKPDDKLEVIKKLQSEGHKVAFVGDGINDAPALTQADIGIAIGAGTDIARESGDMVLIRNSLIDVVVALDLGKKVLRRIQYNLFWAVAYNFSLIPIAAGYLYPVWKIMFRPEFAGLAMAMSSVSVVTLSLLLKRYQPDIR